MTFYTKIDQSIHPKAKNYLNKIKSVKSNVINKKNSTIIKDIQNLYKKFNKPNEFGGTWEWIDKNKSKKIFAKTIKNYNEVSENFNNFFKNDLSYGITSSHWEKQTNKWKKKLASDILKNLDSWEEFVKENDSDYKYLDSKNDPGNPFGLLYKKRLILYDKPRHDYYAKKIIDIFNNDKKIPLIVEVGGGYGGLLSQLIKRKFKFNYINIDLNNSLLVNYYYIKTKHKNINISFKKKVNKNDFKKTDFIFVPFTSDIYKQITLKADLIYNSNSFSEMNRGILQKYFQLINKVLKPKYILHQNSNILLYPKSKMHIEIQSENFPIDRSKYKKLYSGLSLFQGGSGRYREYLYQIIKN